MLNQAMTMNSSRMTRKEQSSCNLLFGSSQKVIVWCSILCEPSHSTSVHFITLGQIGKTASEQATAQAQLHRDFFQNTVLHLISTLKEPLIRGCEVGLCSIYTAVPKPQTLVVGWVVLIHLKVQGTVKLASL